MIAFLTYSKTHAQLDWLELTETPRAYIMFINQFSVVVCKRQHYVFHIFTGYTFVRHFPVLQIQRPPYSAWMKYVRCVDLYIP